LCKVADIKSFNQYFQCLKLKNLPPGGEAFPGVAGGAAPPFDGASGPEELPLGPFGLKGSLIVVEVKFQ
jgi:hypothetical protein